MLPMLKPWMDQFSSILEKPVQPEDPDDWSIRMEVGFVFNFSSHHAIMYVHFNGRTIIFRTMFTSGFKVLESVCSKFPRTC